MKKTVKCMVALCFFFALFLCLPQRVSASEGTYQGLKYKVENQKVTITGCTDSLSGKVTIPEKIEGYPVTEIGEGAFKNNGKITSVTFPDSVATIGSEAFQRCVGLTSVYMGKGVTWSGGRAFAYCDKLKSVYITDFTDLWKIDFQGGGANPLFNGANLYLNGKKVTDLVIPNDFKEITPYAFYGCGSIKSVTLCNGMDSVGAYAFYNCKNLTKVTGTEDATSIGGSAFAYCSNLTEISLKIHWIGSEAFKKCTRLTEISLKDAEIIGPWAFENCKGLTEISLNKITKIGEDAFKNCTNLKRVNITDVGVWCKLSFYSATSNPLYYAKNLYVNGEPVTNAEFPENTNTVGSYVFYNCPTLKTVTIPLSTTKVGKGAFQNCAELTEITFLRGSFDVEENAFSGCKILQYVRFRGKEENLKLMKIQDGNECLKNAVWEYNYHIHSYSAPCDTNCDICQEAREPGPHTYSYDCDEVCDACKATRTAAPHTYDNDCDGVCNLCKTRRWYVANHSYDNDCDTACNICGEGRITTHTYDGFWDEKCNICSAVRELQQDSGQDSSNKVLVLGIGFYGLTYKVPIELPGVAIALIMMGGVAVGCLSVYVVYKIDNRKYGKKEGA